MEEDIRNSNTKAAEDAKSELSLPDEIQKLNRRQLLKVLSASGVVTAASFVPSKWATPVIEGGVLPAHAQITPTYTINCSGGGDITIDQGQNDVVLSFGATAIDSQSNPPPPGTMLQAQLDVVPVQSSTAGTDSSGGVSFSMTVPIGNIQNNTVVATVSFVDSQTFGPSSCQVTFIIVVTPITPTYTLSCSGGGDLFVEPGQNEVFINFGATAMDSQSNPPPVGTMVQAELDVVPTQSDTAGTDSSGGVSFSMNVPIGSIQNNTIVATISFVDTQNFGSSSCQVTYTIILPPQ